MSEGGGAVYLRDETTMPEERPRSSGTSPFEIISLDRSRHRHDRRRSANRLRDTLRRPLRRTGARREGDGDRVYVDRYRGSDAALLLGIFVINIADAYFTLHWIGRGGAEGNPLMEWLLGHGQTAFVFFKCLAVGAWLLVLTVHKNFQLARWGLWALMAFYTALLFYHVFLYVLAEPTPIHLP